MPKSPQQIREEFDRRLLSMGMAYQPNGSPGSMTKGDLLEKLKHHLRLSIATTLKMDAATYASSMPARESVDRCLTLVMAIGYNDALDAAVDDICEMPWNADVDRHALEIEVQGCYNTFEREVAVFTLMHELNQIKIEPEVVFEHVSGFLDIGEDYEDFLDE